MLKSLQRYLCFSSSDWAFGPIPEEEGRSGVFMADIGPFFLFSALPAPLFFFFLIHIFIYLFIFGCVGSSFLCEGFL